MLYMVTDSILYSDTSMDFFVVNEGVRKLLAKDRASWSLEEAEDFAKLTTDTGDDKDDQLLTQAIIDTRKKLNRLTIIITNECNFSCKYCYESWDSDIKLNFETNQDISFKDAIKGIDLFFAAYEEIGMIMFFGGEPLLRPDRISEICDYVHQRHPETRFGIITNGSIYNTAVANLLRTHDFSITVSLDGPKETNDYYRVRRDGSGSYDLISNNIQKMQQDGLRVMVQGSYGPAHIRENVTLFAYTKMLKDELNIYMPHIVPCQLKEGTPESWTKDDINSLITTFIHSDLKNLDYITNGNIGATNLSSFFLDTLFTIVKKKRNILMCPAGIEAAITPTGTIYPCFMLVNKSQNFSLGTLDTTPQMLIDNTRTYLGNYNKSKIEKCEKCWCKNICHGCAGANVNENESHQKPSEMHCSLIKSRSANIIEWLCETRNDAEKWRKFTQNMKTLFETGQNENAQC